MPSITNARAPLALTAALVAGGLLLVAVASNPSSIGDWNDSVRRVAPRPLLAEMAGRVPLSVAVDSSALSIGEWSDSVWCVAPSAPSAKTVGQVLPFRRRRAAAEDRVALDHDFTVRDEAVSHDDPPHVSHDEALRSLVRVARSVHRTGESGGQPKTRGFLRQRDAGRVPQMTNKVLLMMTGGNNSPGRRRTMLSRIQITKLVSPVLLTVASCAGGGTFDGGPGGGGGGGGGGVPKTPTPEPAPTGKVYYIDYATGSDANDGLAAATPWKHAPGDPNAIGNPKGIGLKPGETVWFKGGVAYRGTIDIPTSGVAGSPITYRGNGWGSENAIIDGSELIQTAWNKCLSQADCEGNPNWASIYYTTVPVGKKLTAFTAVHEDDQFLWPSQEPNLPDQFFFDNRGGYRSVPLNSQQVVLTKSNLKDTRHFTSANPLHYEGAYIAVWVQPNIVMFRKILSFDPATKTITFETIQQSLYTDRDGSYSILNSIHVLDSKREYTYSPHRNRLYIWPEDPANLSKITVSTRKYSFNTNGKDYLVIKGFKMQKTSAELKWFGEGVGVKNSQWSDTSDYCTVKNNEITLLRSMEHYPAIHGFGNHAVIENNNIHHNQRGKGIKTAYNDVRVINNTITRVGGTGIYFPGAKNSAIIGNKISEILGSHANAISVYQNSKDILVAGNTITKSNIGLTLDQSDDITVFNNVIDLRTQAGSVAVEWVGVDGDVYVFNNIFIGSRNNNGLSISGDRTFTKNNILDGGGTGVRSNNLFTGLGWKQSAQYKWAPAPGELVRTLTGGRWVGVDMQTVFASFPAYEEPIAEVISNDTVYFTTNVANQYLEVAPGDIIEFNHDGVKRTVLSSSVIVDSRFSTWIRFAKVTFSPATTLEKNDVGSVWKKLSAFNRDLHHGPGGSGVDAGVDVLNHLVAVRAAFPYYDFTKDCEGKVRTGTWDIGAYER